MKIKRDSKLYRYLSFWHTERDMPKTNCQVFRTLFLSTVVLPAVLIFCLGAVTYAMHDFSATIIGMDNWLAWFLVPQATAFTVLCFVALERTLTTFNNWLSELQFKPKKKKEDGPVCSLVQYVD